MKIWGLGPNTNKPNLENRGDIVASSGLFMQRELPLKTPCGIECPLDRKTSLPEELTTTEVRSKANTKFTQDIS
ncbi:Hypothetical protein FKW44_007360 [Caligus rogercresseyi]|uniref:Uncharacterized protein n=1 Tax=Caligus rogercresseyi TaxID=217165 RepID=A0A7T8KEM4_CALRO|nr:Hypothetical protein FKW44_007360 [Caligus rogercresseyi]